MRSASPISTFRLFAAGFAGLALVATAPAAAQRRAPAAVQQARALAASGKTDQAIGVLAARVAKAPKDAASHDALASLLETDRRYPEALAHAEQAVRLKPRENGYRFTRGTVLAELGRFAEAIADFDAAISASPRQASMYVERGMALLSLGRGAEARSDWASARRLDPRQVWADWHEGHQDLIDGNFNMAVRRLSTVALLKPDLAEAQSWLMTAYLLAGSPYQPKRTADPWVNRLQDYHAGRLSFTQLLALATADAASADRRRIGEAWLHHGLRLQRDGLLNEARAAFAEASRVQAPRHAWKLLAEKQASRP
jgi:tetratricopeptide (TPR) repeat protein